MVHSIFRYINIHSHFRILLKLTFDPDSLRHDVSSLRDELTAMMDRVDANTIQGFLIAYGFLCDFFGVEYSKDVSWVSRGSSLGCVRARVCLCVCVCVCVSVSENDYPSYFWFQGVCVMKLCSFWQLPGVIFWCMCV